MSDMGGTWDLFRYPGIRSDSDMYTMGYDFKPWRGGKVLADGPAIKNYIKETAAENNVQDRIRYGHEVIGANWSTPDAQWHVTVLCKDSGKKISIACNLLYMCAGYYSYKEGYTPDFPDLDKFQGNFIHPQYWPEDLDYTGKRVVIIGSGATAVTLLPAMAETAAHVTMLQRSPGYMANRPSYDKLGLWLEKYLPAQTAYNITRWKNTKIQRAAYQMTRIWPSLMKRLLIGLARRHLGPDYDVDKHFTPSYNPWDERLCAIPENDLYKAISAGSASVVTDHIECFTEKGILLKSGDELEADIIVSATGLKLVMLGEVSFSLDGETVNLADTWTYKGVMLSDVPNLLNTWGYINSSWTLRADLIAGFACRLVNKLAQSGMRQVTPRLREQDRDMQVRPWVDDFSAGYFQRARGILPRQGDREPWVNCQNYTREQKLIGRAELDDGVLEYSNPPVELQKAS
jgi:cation diffusion facilitator CzcD-associated flavoprotein CzcO